ncbi:MAG: flagellar filament outer layer protein FlaA [Brevinema sp.]
MKHYLLILFGLMIPIAAFSQLKETFFDFNTFEDKIKEVYTNEQNQLYSKEGIAMAEIGSTMFMLDNWLVTLTNSSGQNPFSRRDSYSKKTTSQEQGTVLGVRVRFPEWPFSGEAFIRPLFPLLPFKATGEYANINNGVITNIGAIKSFSMWVNGRNFPFSIGVRVRDLKNKLTEFSLGSLLYVGWRKLAYNNTAYSKRIMNNLLPPTRIYPSDIPLIRFDSFVVYRSGNKDGGNFIGYFGSSDIEYTPYLVDISTDINDEETWGLIRSDQEQLATSLNSTLYTEILEFEYARKRVEVNSDTPKNNDPQNNAANQTEPAAQ